MKGLKLVIEISLSNLSGLEFLEMAEEINRVISYLQAAFPVAVELRIERTT